MKKIVLTLLISVFAMPAMTQDISGEITIHDRKVEKIDNDIHISFRAEIGKKAARNGRTTVVAPELRGNGYNWSLPAIVVQGGRAIIAEQRHDWASEAIGVGFDKKTIYTKPGTTVNYQATVAWQPWMEGADLLAEGIDMGCCSHAKATPVMMLAENLALLPTSVVKEPEPIIEIPVELPKSTGDKLAQNYSYILPATEFEKIEPGKLFDDDRENSLTINFAQGKFTINHNLGGNNRSLIDMMASIRMIENSMDSKVKGVIIAGFASPEGSFELNDRLAWNRAVSVKEYIMNNSSLTSEAIVIYNGSSDWRGLKMLVEKSDMYLKYRIVDILDNTPMGRRLAELQKLDGGKPYRYMYHNFFPQLRNAAYIKVYYENKTDSEK